MWSKSPITQKFLEINYVSKFSFNTYWLVTLTTLLLALLIFKILFFVNKKFNEKFLYEEEPYLVALGIILNPWPMLFFFIFASILCLLILQIFNLLRQKMYFKNQKAEFERIPMINIWIPAMFVSTFIYFVIFSNLFPILRNLLLSNWFIYQLLNKFSIF
jgi:hypothetical protein